MTSRIPQELVDVHRRNNRNSAELGEAFAPHREKVTELACGGVGESLAVLGAGNCNDLDLPRLHARFPQIHLVDLDREALERARDRQAPEVAGGLTLHAPLDLSGALDRLRALKGKGQGQAIPAAQLEALPREAVATVRAALPETFDTVVSACMLSQLMFTCRVTLGTQHPSLELVGERMTVAHVRTLVSLVKPGGMGILVTDAVSSQTYPLEELWGQQAPLALLRSLEQTNNIFNGTGPTTLRAVFTRDPDVSAQVEGARIVEPWLWRLGPEVTLLAYAWVFRRKP